jgi:hypothetical protein
MQAIAIRRHGPRQEDTSAELHLAPLSHAVGHQGSFICCHGPADLQQEMGLQVLPQRWIQALDATAGLFELFQQDHLMHIVPGEPIWTGDNDSVKRGLFDSIPHRCSGAGVETVWSSWCVVQGNRC